MDRAELRKAAIVLASLDQETAAEVCKRMSEVEAERLLKEIATLGPVPPEEQREVLAAFREHMGDARPLGGAGVAEELMDAVLGPRGSRRRDPKQQSALERVRALSKSDPNTVRRLLQGEAPPMVALILAQLTPEKAAQVLEAWPEEERADLTWRVATLGQLAPGTLEAIGEQLGARSYLLDDESTTGTGVGFVVKLLEDMDRATGKQLLEELRARDEELAAQVEDQLFTFDSVIKLPERDFQLVLRALDHAVIARALKGMDDEVVQLVFANLSQRAQEILEQEMELLGPVLVSEVEAAQKEFVQKALELEDAGEISLSAQKQAYIE